MKLRRTLGFLALLLVSSWGIADAQAYPVTPPALFPCTLTTSTPTICNTGQAGKIFYGVVNDSLTSQSVSVLCYDNAQQASGTVVASIAALGPTQIITWPAGGRRLNFGLTCVASGTPGGSGIDIWSW